MKKERNRDIIAKTIFNKMVEHLGIDMDYLIALPREENGRTLIEGRDWFHHYTMTTQQYEDWKKWSMEYLKTTNILKSRHERELSMFALVWGLRIEDKTDIKNSESIPTEERKEE